ncbi:hypothetical protein [Rhizobium sp. 25PS6]|uniref:hypothetical protein n=1 Tax=Rhizobium sp. 25PS6 TaxID=3075622 RepID=UPI003966C516
MFDDTSPRREATKIWHAVLLELLYLPFSPACRRPLGRRTEREIVSLGIFEISQRIAAPAARIVIGISQSLMLTGSMT